jgi:hypothetical protein
MKLLSDKISGRTQRSRLAPGRRKTSVIAKKRVAAQGAVLHGNIALMSARVDAPKILITISETE